MADNIVAEQVVNAGATFATDQDGSLVHHPLAKLEWGALNTFTLVDQGASAVPIQDGGNSITVDNAGTFAVQATGTVTANQGTAGSVGAGWLTRFDRPTTAALSRAAINISASGDNTIVSGVGGQTVRVFKIFFVCSAAVNVTIKDGASTSLTGAMAFSANGALTLDFDSEAWFITSSSNAFIINLSGAQQVSGAVYYTQS